MSYHIYTTKGIILKRKVFGEADVILHIITQDLGLILAFAKSARLSQSKLRGGLQEYSLLTVSCIKGKNGWKVTNISGENNIFFELPTYSRRILVQLSSFLVKNIVGELPHRQIFEITKSGFEYIKNIPKENANNFEVLFVLRLLRELGYVVLNQNTEEYLKSPLVWNEEKFTQVEKNKTKLVELINKALKESQI